MSDMDQFDRLAEARYRKIFDSQPCFVWRQFADGEQLKARVFFPENHDRRKLASSVVFFHGGMWQATNEVEFVPWALQLAQYGIVSILPEYRTRRNYEVSGSEIMEEAREAWMWVYDNALELGLSQRRITLAGSDAGGLMAVHASIGAQTTKWKWFRKTVTTDPQPAAVVMFRGVTNPDLAETKKMVGDMDAETLRKLNPAHRIRKGLPALFASHGNYDKLLPWRMGEQFVKLWRKSKNPASFLRLDNADHAYYHFNVNAVYFEHVLTEWVNFMVEQKIWQIDEVSNDLLLV